ncbi:methyltransferase type 12 [Paractinoplanes abujensis]|uniref:SAM-dependent methyltransferase n=1 Tax=Paractinoplanes abujensis TaxID=882441 RepID=A0A7W7G079_9ACTN|nr:class I SAM-dependent methyltransferase [Actinoplanes abujensis]MBB4692843.1 SAM-dependent methyltransferase [Actinoplanes abujensis]GID22657.1 methyltransferase type 12 [Actinoplanes abujensis]
MTGAALFDAALRRAATGRAAAFAVRNPLGELHPFDPAAWCRDELPGDAALVARCAGPVLDVGCGPGRLVGALAAAGRSALGIDVSEQAVRLTRRRGAAALRRDVFGPVPGLGRWHDVLLADGNVGIGGDPVRLLRRCRRLLAPAGRLHAELGPPGSPSWSGTTRVHTADGSGAELAWAAVPADDLARPAAEAGLRVLDVRTEAGRWFATLTSR